MFDGKMLRGLTGTPMRRIDLANSSFAEAEPEPFTLANFTTKAFTDSIRFVMGPYAAFFWGARQPCPACVRSRRNFCMSQAPVGQRSAHRPQCRHTSSSFTITFEVLSGPDT